MNYKYFGLLAFVILLCGLLFIVWRWPQGKHLTFSQHVAVARHRIVYYIVLFAIVLPLLLLFFLKWFVPAFNLSIWFSIFLVAAALTQQACTLIPELGGWKTRYHKLLAGISAVCLLPPLLLLFISGTVPLAGKFLTLAGLLVMLGIMYTIAKNKGTHDHFLILQSSYFAAFFVPVLFISYL